MARGFILDLQQVPGFYQYQLNQLMGRRLPSDVFPAKLMEVLKVKRQAVRGFFTRNQGKTVVQKIGVRATRTDRLAALLSGLVQALESGRIPPALATKIDKTVGLKTYDEGLGVMVPVMGEREGELDLFVAYKLAGYKTHAIFQVTVRRSELTETKLDEIGEAISAYIDVEHAVQTAIENEPYIAMPDIAEHQRESTVLSRGVLDIDYFRDEAAEIFERVQEGTDEPFALLHIECEAANAMRDKGGNSSAEHLLSQTALTLAAKVRHGDLVALGDGFISVLLRGVNSIANTEKAAFRLRNEVAAKLFIGGSQFHSGRRDVRDINELLYAAKSARTMCKLDGDRICIDNADPYHPNVLR